MKNAGVSLSLITALSYALTGAEMTSLVPRLGFLLGYSVPEFRRFDVTRRYI
eukprot:COSAG01_NODE_462_length_16681_cov_4.001206_1_plen_52_part_00